MAKEDVEKHIREQLSQPTEIGGDDLEPPKCTWCGDALGPDVGVVVWDIPEHGDESTVWRYRYCSEDCKRADMEAVMENGQMHPYGEPERLTEEEREQYE